jgi:hydrogenase maturation protease
MTAQVPTTAVQPIAVEVLICGSLDRNDDGGPIAVAAQVCDRLPLDVRLRIVGQLDIDDLLTVPAAAGLVIVDAATGLEPGQIVDLPLNGLTGGPRQVRPRSSHTLAFPEVVGLAELIQGAPVRGRIVAIGGIEFGFGTTLSEPVAAALPALVSAILGAVEEIRPARPPETRP